jgi:hypothetical protein
MINLQLKFGEVTICDHYIIGVMNEGENINIEMVSEITSLANKYYKGEPWGYISNRIHSYALDPIVHLEAPEFEKNMVAFAAVTHRKETEITTVIEKEINKIHKLGYEFATFTDLDKAKDWVKSVLLKK